MLCAVHELTTAVTKALGMGFENPSKQVHIDKPKPIFTWGIQWNSSVVLTECCKVLRRRLLKVLRAQSECD